MAHATTALEHDLATVLRRYARALLRHLPRARRGHARAIHQARVASRRLREALPIAAGAARAGSWTTLRRDVRRVTRALGDVREMDVALTEFQSDVRAHRWSAAAVQRVLEHLKNERTRRAHAMRAKLDGVNATRLAERGKALAAAVEQCPVQTWRSLLGSRLRKRSRRFKAALQAVGTLYAPERLHVVRIAAKKLRYTLELAQGAGGAALGRDLATLRRLQNLLGRLRDLQMLQSHVQTVAADAGGEPHLTRALDAISAGIEAECRDLHAEFLRRTDRLAALANRVSRETAVELAPRTHRMAKASVHAVRRIPRAATA